MSQDYTTPSATIDLSTLLPPLKRMFGREDVTAIKWDQRTPGGTAGTSGGAVTLLTGTATVDGQPRPWSLVRKRLVPPAGRQADPSARRHTPSGYNYWRRELLCFQSGLLDDLPEGFAAPRCYYAEETADGCTLWMEEIRDEISLWPLERYGTAARHLGHWSGACLVNRTIPDYPWLTADLLEQRAQRWVSVYANLDELRQHSIVRRGWPDDVAQGLLRIWQEREQFFRRLHSLPPVLQHGDAGRKNLMSRTSTKGEMETVAIDWGYFGVGALGEEIAATVVCPVIWFNGMTAAQLPELEEIILDGYLHGLRQAGWRGDPRLVRLGYLCAVALRYGPTMASPEIISVDMTAEELDSIEQELGWSIEEWADCLAPMRRFAIQRADQARQLMAEL
jgi:hypothetical protein